MKRQSFQRQMHNVRKARQGQQPKRDRVPRRFQSFFNAASDLWSRVVSLGGGGRYRPIRNNVPQETEEARLVRQFAHRNQLRSHMPPAIWPRHLGETPFIEGVS